MDSGRGGCCGKVVIREEDLTLSEAEEAELAAGSRIKRRVVEELRKAAARYMPCVLGRLVPALDICPVSSCDWFPPQIYALCPCAIGSRPRYMPCALM